MASPYTFLSVDTVTQQVKAQLPLTGVSFETKLNAAGSMTATLPVSDPQMARLAWDAATTPTRTSLYVLRNDAAVWGGIVWTREYDSDTQAVKLQAGTFETYYEHIPYGSGRTWTNVDQCQIVRDIIAAVGSIGYVLPMPVSNNFSGVFRTYTALGYDYKWVSDHLRALQELPNGFDLAVDVYYTPTLGPFHELNMGFPRRGRLASETPIVFEYPGNVSYYRWPEDGTLFATDVIETGNGNGPNMPVGVAGDPSLLAAGWPIMYQQVSRKDVSNPSFLAGYAGGDLALWSSPPVTAEIHVRADVGPTLDSYDTGDDIRFRVDPNKDPRFTDGRPPGYADGLDTFLRIVSVKVQVGDDGDENIIITATETAT